MADLPDVFETHMFSHPALGQFTGRISSSTPAVVQLRSIPFASIPGRFRQSVMMTSFEEQQSRDFTNYGTACPAPAQLDQIETAGGKLPGEEDRKFDEYSCLNLTISAPKDALGNQETRLPVMVYVHGGAFKVGGAHVSALHDTTRLVDLSIREGHPVIIVSIHYRLNWQGFLACKDLVDEAFALGEPPSNFGLYDQRIAFLWVKRFITGFGGDPSRITAFGESAGSVSIATLMCSDVPLFNRAILMSGTPATVPPATLQDKETEYRKLLSCCGIDERDPRRLEKLRKIPVGYIVKTIAELGIQQFHPLRDESFFPRGFPTWYTQDEIIGNCDWVDQIVIGDAFMEGWIWADDLKRVSLPPFLTLSDETFGAEIAGKVLHAYNIKPGMDDNTFWTKLIFLMGDLMFSAPNHQLACSLASNCDVYKKKVYRYTITLRNPFPGSYLLQIPGHHFIELLFLFQTLRERYPSKRLQEVSEEFGRRWLKFGAGLEPWGEFKVGQCEENIMVISGSEGWTLRTREDDERLSDLAEEGERRYAGWEVLTEAIKAIVVSDKEKFGGRDSRTGWDFNEGIFRLMES